MTTRRTLNENAVLAHVQSRLSDLLMVDAMPADVDLIETGALSSSMFLAVLADLEDEFHIQVAGADLNLDNFRTPSRIARFVCWKRSEG